MDAEQCSIYLAKRGHRNFGPAIRRRIVRNTGKLDHFFNYVFRVDRSVSFAYEGISILLEKEGSHKRIVFANRFTVPTLGEKIGVPVLDMLTSDEKYADRVSYCLYNSVNERNISLLVSIATFENKVSFIVEKDRIIDNNFDRKVLTCDKFYTPTRAVFCINRRWCFSINSVRENGKVILEVVYIKDPRKWARL